MHRKWYQFRPFQSRQTEGSNKDRKGSILYNKKKQFGEDMEWKGTDFLRRSTAISDSDA